ncbi:hypothetical protein [Mammaliicoccus sp. N-M50]|uniref:hypothetical protein n=1 Tax=Mammaliicoccus sp. N-M50 TaxID=2898709 RepID=UPI001EFA7BE9|nr:hypothetical protein [Mammaliicoccus sp. N-M50]
MDFQFDSSIISAISAIFSAVAAIFSLLIARSNLSHIKNKEAPNIAITSNFKYFNTFIDQPDMYYKEFIKKHQFNIQNLSLLQIDLLSIEITDVIDRGKKELYKNSSDNPEFSFLGGASDLNPIIKNMQSYQPSLHQKFNSIEAKSAERYDIPLFILQDFVQATYKMKIDERIKIKRRANLNIRFYDISRNKIVKKKSKLIYYLEYQGTIGRISFNLEPKIIKLSKSFFFRGY